MVVVVVVDVKAEDDTTDYGVDFGTRRSFALRIFGGSITTILSYRYFSTVFFKEEDKKKERKKEEEEKNTTLCTV